MDWIFGGMKELQEELLIEILSRLPVKSLIRCSCVSKYWLSVIRSPEFATKHYSSRSKSEYDSVLAVYSQGCSISIFSYQDLSLQTAFKFRPAVAYDPLRFQIYHRDIINRIFIVGPCNGLFLIQLVKGFSDLHVVILLWNPATREVFKLPIADGLNFCLSFGFGFDSVTNDYKAVGLYGMTNGMIDNRIVWLYSLATNSWRQLVDANFLDIHCDALTRVNCGIGSSFNGRMINWILEHDYRSRKRDSLLSFDMVDEVFVETPLPYDVCGFMYQGSNHIHMYPTVYSFLTNDNKDIEQLCIWVLEGYGPTGVWNKQLNISFPQLRTTPYMVLWKNKEIVFSLLHCGIITSLNLTTHQMKSLQIPADGIVIGYTESLVSIANYVRHCQPPTRGLLPSIGIPLQLLQIGEDQQPLQLEEEQLPLQLEEEEQLPLQLEEEEQLPLQVEEEKQLPLHLQLEEEEQPEEDDHLSTDSAFLVPGITAFTDPNTIYIDYETDLDFYPHRKNEVERLSKLPYCLYEVNHPMISNPCTF
ncbi:hypothetical protein RDABS01_020540 [Bienertia sinuspersici]